MNNTITEMKNTLEGINNRITEAEERISEVERANLPKKEFKVVIVKIHKELGRRMDEQSEKLEVFIRVRKYKEQQNRDEKCNY